MRRLLAILAALIPRPGPVRGAPPRDVLVGGIYATAKVKPDEWPHLGTYLAPGYEGTGWAAFSYRF